MKSSDQFVGGMSYGTIAEITVRTSCPYCQFILKLITMSPQEEHFEYANTAEFRLYPLRETEFSTITTGYATVHFKLKEEKFRTGMEPPTESGYADVVSIPRVKTLLQECDATEDKLRVPNGKVHQPFKLRLVDVRRRCLVEANTNCRYVVLSYVWGKGAKFLRTTKSNLSRLSQDGSLSRQTGVPTLIDDSIELVRAIGEDYLWVDALCLIQDDSESKYAGIRNMHLIYSRAYLTIVAASAKSAHSSLPGFRRGTRAPAMSETVKGRNLRSHSLSIAGFIDTTVYNSRGWTMQEFMLSSRCLIFTDNLVAFRSSSELTEEPDYKTLTTSSIYPGSPLLFYCDHETQRKKEHDLFTRRQDHASPFLTPHDTDACLKFLVYAKIVLKYSKRQLSYDSDILNAFRALQDAMEDDHGTKFFFGMPLATIGMALLWIPCTPSASRRTTSEISSDRRIQAVFPSWSWVGWKTAVEWEFPIRALGFRGSERGKYHFEELVPISRMIIVETEKSNAVVIRLYEQIARAGRPILYASLGLLEFTAQSVKVSSFNYRPVKYHLVRTALEVVPVDPRCTKGDEKQIGGAKSYLYRVLTYDEKAPRVPDEMDDGKGRGLLWGVELEEIQNGTDLELVALSSFMPYLDEKGDFPIPFYHYNDSCKCLRELPFLNCLVIRWYGDVAERIGVAQIGTIPWQDAKPTLKAITLR